MGYQGFVVIFFVRNSVQKTEPTEPTVENGGYIILINL
jgi:hypothetical protein